MSLPTTLEVTEYEPKSFSAALLPEAVAQLLWDHYSAQIEIETPSFKTGNQWRLKSRGWVGHIPVTEDFRLNLLPKVSLVNLFGMYEYAYNLESFRFLDGMVGANSLIEFYEQLPSAARGNPGFTVTMTNIPMISTKWSPMPRQKGVRRRYSSILYRSESTRRIDRGYSGPYIVLCGGW
jgi:hypothetical protein